MNTSNPPRGSTEKRSFIPLPQKFLAPVRFFNSSVFKFLGRNECLIPLVRIICGAGGNGQVAHGVHVGHCVPVKVGIQIAMCHAGHSGRPHWLPPSLFPLLQPFLLFSPTFFFWPFFVPLLKPTTKHFPWHRERKKNVEPLKGQRTIVPFHSTS